MQAFDWLKHSQIKKSMLFVFWLIAVQTSNTINFRLHYTFEIVPELVISDLRLTSPAYIAGLQVGDVVLSINNQES